MNRFALKTLVGTCVFLLATVISAHSQIDSMMNVYGEQYTQEKTYVQFDKPAYNSGETIWFKAYLFAGITPSLISKNFYAEILDPSGKLLQRKVMPVYESTSSGSFDLPANLSFNSVVFRAYTTWMLNFDTAFLFTKTIRVLNAKSTNPSSPAATTVSLKFFPEGGDLVNGVESVIAFKAADQYGYPVEVQGLIKEASGTAVTNFSSVHDGMGKFVLEPKPGTTYYAEWKDEKKQTHKTNLPNALATGIVLRTIQSENKQTFIVKRSPGAPDNMKTLHVIGYFSQQVVYKARLNMSESLMTSGAIPLDQLPTGILQLTIFDASWRALAERIVFVNKEDYSFTAKINPAAKSVDKRGKNVIIVEVPDTIRSNLSIAVTDAGVSKSDPDADNIISHLLLTGDLKGYVFNPYYYFSGNDDTVRSHLDLVMMTNGWRRFKWEDLAAGKVPLIKYPRENYLSLNAELTGLLPSQVPKNAQMNVFLQARDSSKQFFILPINDKGKFSEDGLIFFDTMHVYYQFNKDKNLDNKASVNFNNGTYKGLKSINPDTSWRIPMLLDTALLNRSKYFAVEAARLKPELEKKVKVLDAVTVRARAKSQTEIMDDKYTSGFFKGGDASNFDLTDDPTANSAIDIFQYLQGRVAGLQITTGPQGPTLTWRQATPSLFLNEMPIQDATQIQSIPVTDIAYVKVFRPPFFGAMGGGAGGAIAIYTKRGNDGKPVSTVPGGLAKNILVGYAPLKQFYSPDYSRDQNADIPDIRTTLYWAPYILTDAKSHRVTITFYNNDVTTRMRVVLEGMNEQGQLTRVEKLID